MIGTGRADRCWRTGKSQRERGGVGAKSLGQLAGIKLENEKHVFTGERQLTVTGDTKVLKWGLMIPTKARVVFNNIQVQGMDTHENEAVVIYAVRLDAEGNFGRVEVQRPTWWDWVRCWYSARDKGGDIGNSAI